MSDFITSISPSNISIKLRDFSAAALKNAREAGELASTACESAREAGEVATAVRENAREAAYQAFSQQSLVPCKHY